MASACIPRFVLSMQTLNLGAVPVEKSGLFVYEPRGQQRIRMNTQLLKQLFTI